MTERVDDGADQTSGSMIVNPKAPKPETVGEEGAGVVTSDSLAAESLRSGGEFAQGRTVPSAVPSKSHTATTADASAATVLAPAPDAASRDIGLEDYEQRPGTTADAGAYDTSKGGPQAADGGAAPTYVSTVTGAASTAAEKQPKGVNLQEGGFDPNAPNASSNTSIGSKNDPGRLGLLEAEKANAVAAADSGYDHASAGADAGGGKGGFENLEERQA